MLGYEWDEVVGKIYFPDLLTPASQAKFSQSFPEFQNRGWVKDLEFELVRKDRSVLPISLSATVIRDDNGNYLMSRSVVIDLYKYLTDNYRSSFKLNLQLRNQNPNRGCLNLYRSQFWHLPK